MRSVGDLGGQVRRVFQEGRTDKPCLGPCFPVRVAEYRDDKMMCSMTQMGSIRKWQVQLSPEAG